MAKLDVIGTMTEAYKGAGSHFSDMIRKVWVPVTLYLAGMVAVTSLLQSKLVAINPEASPEEMQQHVAELLQSMVGWPLIVAILLSLFVWPIIAVAWHRFILLGETGTSAFSIRFGQREARFLIISIFLMLLQLPSMIVDTLSCTVDPQSAAASTFAFVSAVLYLAGIFYFIRLSLLLPAASIDEPLDVGRILTITKGNFWRLLAVQVLTAIVFFVGFVVLSSIVQILATLVGLAGLVQPLLIGLMIVGWMILSVAITSIAYRDLNQAS